MLKCFAWHVNLVEGHSSFSWGVVHPSVYITDIFDCAILKQLCLFRLIIVSFRDNLYMFLQGLFLLIR